jgi:hypothetical protein
MTRERPGVVLLLGLADMFLGVFGIFLGIGMMGKQLLQLGLQPVLPKRTAPPWSMPPGTTTVPQVELPELPFFLQQMIPSYVLTEMVSGLVVLLCGALLLAAGYGLLHMRPAARWAAFAYSTITIVWQLSLAIYQIEVVMPVIDRYFRMETQRWYYANAESYKLGVGFFLAIQVGLLVGHALAQVVILLLPPVNAAFAGKLAAPETPAAEPRPVGPSGAGAFMETPKLEAGS